MRIISHLIAQKTPIATIAVYVEYTTWVADYLESYIHKGVFLMDEGHRIRVAHESRRFIAQIFSPREYQKTLYNPNGKVSVV